MGSFDKRITKGIGFLDMNKLVTNNLAWINCRLLLLSRTFFRERHQSSRSTHLINYIFTRLQSYGLVQIKTFADDKVKMTLKLYYEEKKLSGKGENVGHQWEPREPMKEMNSLKK